MLSYCLSFKTVLVVFFHSNIGFCYAFHFIFPAKIRHERPVSLDGNAYSLLLRLESLINGKTRGKYLALPFICCTFAVIL